MIWSNHMLSIPSKKITGFGIVFFIFFLFASYSIPAAYIAEAQQMSEAEKQAQEAKWREELAATEAEIAKWQGELNKTKQGTKSLQGEAAILQAKINEAKAFIKQRQVQIEQLTRDIGEKTRTISALEAKMNRGKESLASILRATNEIDSYSLPEVMLSNQNISAFFEDVDSYNTLKASLKEEFDGIRELQSLTESERKALDTKRAAEADRKAQIETDKKKIELNEIEKQKLITISKSTEKTYEQVIADKQRKAAEIRAALFRLRDTEGIPFGDALNYATIASRSTGVRPALILAILTQESDLGKNVGSCLVANLDNGDGAGKNTGTLFEQVMKAPRDTIPFKDITERLGRDWKMTPVSCPPGTRYVVGRGFGGAMGPSQFIPSTWELFKDRIGPAVGVSAAKADPWNPSHAFTATALYLADLGASAGGYTAERNAACRYYSGRSCDAKAPANTFYGNQVMAKAENIQLTMIDPLEGF
jgi:membrane-bound lytic murein transglycosylase B